MSAKTFVTINILLYFISIHTCRNPYEYGWHGDQTERIGSYTLKV